MRLPCLSVVLALSVRSSTGREVPDWRAFAVLQFSMVSLWWLADEWGVPQISKVPTTHLLLGVGLVGVGQVRFCLVHSADTIEQKNDEPSVLQTLNVSMYNAIGKKGVYYGEKLGSKVPWCTSFPFSVVSHPQYVGSVLSIWGVFALVYAQGPATLCIVATYWTWLYFVTGLIEQFL